MEVYIEQKAVVDVAIKNKLKYKNDMLENSIFKF